LFNLALETMQALLLVDIAADLHSVVVKLGIDGGSFDNKAILAVRVGNIDSEIAVVLSLRSLIVLVMLVFLT